MSPTATKHPPFQTWDESAVVRDAFPDNPIPEFPKYDERDAAAKLMSRKRAKERDITIPAVVNPERKAACANDVVLFASTYFSEPPDPENRPRQKGLCYGKPAQMHIDILRDFQDRILYGGLEALAAPRGGGKDTCVEVAAMWAIFYGHCSFFVAACYEAGAAKDRIDTIKEQIEINHFLMEDFPEVCAPVRALNRAAQRAKQQTHAGKFTRIEWGETLVFPCIPGSMASGNIIAPGSLNGSIRGLNIGGRRPDFCAISDPQTHDTAKSPQQQAYTLEKIQQDFGGLASYGDTFACVALVTIIKRGDVADQLTNPDLFPQWNGRRYQAMVKWPEDMDLWEEYTDLLRAGSKTNDPTGRKAHKFYLKNRKAMDAGAEVFWEDAYIKAPAPDGSQLEESALQHLFNLRYKWGEDAFEIEYQNSPPDDDEYSHITAELVASRLSLYPHNIAPPDQDSKLVQFIDVGGRELHYAVLACDARGTGTFIDYNRIKIHAPEGNLRSDDGDIRQALELAVLKELRRRRDEVRGELTPYKNAKGEPMEIQMNLVDSGYLTTLIYKFIRESGPLWRAAKGCMPRGGFDKYTMPKKCVKKGDHWHATRQPKGVLWNLDADFWKLHAHERFLQSPGTVGAVSLFGSEPRLHRRSPMFASHIVSERWEPDRGKWIVLTRYNHFLDCAAGCFAAASMVGVRITGEVETQATAQSGGKSTWQIGR